MHLLSQIGFDLEVVTCAALLTQSRLILPSCPAAPPDYSSVVTEEEAEQRNNAVSTQPSEDLSGILERPLMAFVQEFRFRPPPVYSEVSLRGLGMVHMLLPYLCTNHVLFKDLSNGLHVDL